ncbi:MAG: T9SS type B sorting domain-containing protein, partial [Tenacibaculum sp.]
CLNSSTGELSFDFNSSTPYTGSYDYELFNSSTGLTTGITGTNTTGLTSISNLGAASYYVQIKQNDSPYCQVRSSNISIDEPQIALKLAATPTLISCVGPNSGEVLLTATGGWGAYEYKLVNTTTSITIQNFNPSNTISNLDAGQYTATVKDLNGCTNSVSFQLFNPSPITASYTLSPNQCNGQSTASIAIINPAGGQGNPVNYTYTLTYPDNTVSAYQTSNVFANLPAGIYQATVYDAYSCRSQPISITITDPSIVSVKASIIEDITCDRQQATVELSGQGGAGGYTFSTDGINFVSNSVFNVDAGQNSFYTKDADGCISDPFTVATVSPYNALTPVLNTDSGFITCKGEKNGMLMVSATGGLGNYQYQLLDADNTVIRPLQSSGVFLDLDVGAYKVRVSSSNANGDLCQVDTALHDIVEPSELTATAVSNNVSCYGGADGSIVVNANGGNAGYQYNISPGFDSNKFVNTNVFENLASGNYLITVKDKVGCYQVVSATINEPTQIDLTLDNVTQQICSYDPSPTISLEVSGGSFSVGSAQYTIYVNGVPLASTYSEGKVVLGASEGISDDKAYGISAQVVGSLCSPTPLKTTVTTTKAIDLQLQGTTEFVCPLGSIIRAKVQDEYKNQVVYSLYESSELLSSNDTGVFTNIAPGNNYYVQAEHIIEGCSITTNISGIPNLQALSLAIDNTKKNKLIAQGKFGLPPYQYSFDDGSFSFENEITILKTKDYKIVVKDSRGCQTASVIRGEYISIEVPNIFTPDGDGVNDYWYPINVEDYHDVRVFIYDRYARMINTFEGMHQGWDGTYQGKELPSGDYWYTISFKELSGEQKRFMGHFTLYR